MRRPIIAMRRKPSVKRIGHGDDLADPRLDESLHALADRGLGEPDAIGEARVRHAAVVLERLDQCLVGLVEDDRVGRLRHDTTMA